MPRCTYCIKKQYKLGTPAGYNQTPAGYIATRQSASEINEHSVIQLLLYTVIENMYISDLIISDLTSFVIFIINIYFIWFILFDTYAIHICRKGSYHFVVHVYHGQTWINRTCTNNQTKLIHDIYRWWSQSFCACPIVALAADTPAVP